MIRKYLYIILGGVILLGIIFFFWFWLFHSPSSTTSTGQFGSAGDKTNTANNQNNAGNGQINVPAGVTVDTTNGVELIQGVTTPQQDITDLSYVPPGTDTGDTLPPPDVTWYTGNNGQNFDLTPINDVNSGTINGSPTISTITGADGKKVSLASSLAVIVGGCLLNYYARELIIEPPIIAIDTAAGSVSNALSQIPLIGGFFGGLTGGTLMSDPKTHGKQATETVGQCLTRTLGRLAVQKITESTVNWINSGFNGKPAFVQDYQKFFTDAADQAAGSYIQSTAFAFLCSPFKLQVKIAVAQSYAHRNGGGGGNSCTLSGVTKNIDKFMNGDFTQGGWPALLSFTTTPTNNPFGAYMQTTIGIQSATANARALAAMDVSTGGFLNYKKCTGPIDPKTNFHTPPCVTVTPGSQIEASLVTAMGADTQLLGLGDSIDQILGALQNALITKVLYKGLANIGPTDTTNAPATTAAGKLMDKIQTAVAAAQQYAGVEQRAIVDVETSQQNLGMLANCWTRATSSPSLTADQLAQANTGYTGAVTQIQDLETKVTELNNNIQTANTSIATLQQIQTDLLLATVASDVTRIQNQFDALVNSDNPHVYDDTDLTTAQQDRTTLQAQMAAINQTTSLSLNQCYALGQ